jgi:uncharacterized membrane protein
MPTNIRPLMIAAVMLTFSSGRELSAETTEPVVRAVLFFSPTCAHCAKVKEEVLPPLLSRYGSQLQIATVNTTTQSGHELFLSACMKHGLLRLSVPLLIVGNTPMVGANEIPLKFPQLIEKHIAAGGIDWPGIPGLSTMLAESPAFAPDPPQHTELPAAKPTTGMPAPNVADTRPQAKPSPEQTIATAEKKPPASALPPSTTLNSRTSEGPDTGLTRSSSAPSATFPSPADKAVRTDATPPLSAAKSAPSGVIDLTGGEAEVGVVDRIKRDIYGNGLAILVLAGMVLTLLASPAILKKSAISGKPFINPRYDWLIPILALAGLAVAAYLSHVEVRKVEAVCGPVGDCNTVNQSEYAKIFGILPIGVLGLLGFIAILTAWTLRRWGTDKTSLWAALGILGMTAVGTLFSVYLTFLEPFVIGATCLWCLSSAVIMTSLFVLALKPGRQAWALLK